MSTKHRLLALLTCCALALSTGAYAQKVNLQLSGVTVGDAISTLNRTENYSVIVNSDEVNLSRRVNVSAKDATIDEVLRQIFAGQNVAWAIDGRRITVTGKPQERAASQARPALFRGQVVDGNGEPLPGASVVIKGTSKGVSADVSGNFDLLAKDFPLTVVVGFIGMADKEIHLTGNERQPYVIVLNEQTVLDEVVVVGYGTQKRVNVTGAVSVIDGKDLQQRPVTNAVGALQGADPSLLITTSSGTIESKNYNVSIRGTLSLNSGEPLILVDGVEGSLTQLNPNDIASISVLKDASATAIYGTKGSAGVILITTKSGEEGKLRINYNGRYSISDNTTRTDFMTSSYDYVTLCNEFYTYLKGYGAWTYSDDQIEMLKERRYDVTEDPSRPWVIPDVTETYKYVYLGNYDWYGHLFNRTRPETEHNISVSGGNDKVNYYASGRYLYREGFLGGVAQDTYNGFSFRSKVDVKVTPWLVYSNNLNFERTQYSYGGYWEIDGTEGLNSTGVLYNLIQNVGPNYVPFNPDGTVNIQPGFMADATSPLFSGRGGPYIVDTNDNNRTNNYINMTNRFTAKLFPGMELVGDYSYRRRDKLSAYRSLPTPNSYDNANKRMYKGSDALVPQGQFYNGSVYDFYEDQRYYYDEHIINAYARYNGTFGKHSVGLTAGANFNDFHSSTLTVKQKYSLSESLSYIDISLGDPIFLETAKNGDSSYRTLGYFGRLNYDYAGRYLLEVSGRYDGSSRFPKGHRWAAFPSVSAGWRISEEPFWTPICDWWNNAKIRLSYGSLGNQQIDNFYYWDTISTSQKSYTFDGSNKISSASSSAPVSSGLTWETVTTKNLGIDLGFLRDRLNMTADFYIRDTKNMLTKGFTTPNTFGAQAPKENAADLRTTGYELSVTWRDRVRVAGKPMSYRITGTLGDYKSVITKFDNPEFLLSDNYVGKVLGEIWGYRATLFQTDEEAAAYEAEIDDKSVNKAVYAGKAPNNHLMAGDVKFLNLNDDKIITPGKSLDDTGDREIIGNSRPRYLYSLRGDVNWLGFDLQVFLQGIGKIDWRPEARSDYFWSLYAYQRPSFVPKDFEAQCWSSEEGADNSNAYFPRRRSKYTDSSIINTDLYLQNAAYLRLKNLTLGYTLPFKGKDIQRARIYFSGENLWYWSPLKKHTQYIDPEVATSSAYNSCIYPYSRTFTFGVDITF